MKAGILAIGTELLMGQTLNSNAAELSRELSEIGVGVYLHYTVGDNRQRMATHLKMLMDSCDLVITTGGLGPTQDDITKDVLAEVLNVPMVLHEPSLEYIKKRFMKFNRTMPDNNLRQAYFPEGAFILDNEKGTAPACRVELDHCTVIVLPGPPSEMRHVFHAHVKPYLLTKTDSQMYSAYLSIYDMGESMVEEKLLHLIDNQTDPTLATYAGDGKVLLRVTASMGTKLENQQKVDQMVSEIKEIIGAYVVSDKGESLPEVLLNLLSFKQKTVAFAESCTGGKMVSSLVSYSGASNCVHSGIVCYSNDSKIKALGVSENTLAQSGAVSRETCLEMTRGILRVSGADFGVAVTGIAGPLGGSDEKPVGLVYIGIGYEGGVEVHELHFFGDREQIQNRVSLKGLKLIYDKLQNM